MQCLSTLLNFCHRKQHSPGFLTGLKKINWRRLKHAYGRASDTPRHIRALASRFNWRRENAFEKLLFSIVHQGSVYEAAVYAVPFLVELLQEPGVEDKQNILELLTELATGHSWHYSHQGFTAFLDPTNPDYQAKMQEELGWVADLESKLPQYMTTYYTFLDSTDKATFRGTASLLRCLKSEKEQTCGYIIEKLSADPGASPETIADLLCVLSSLDQTANRELFQRYFDAGDDELLTVTAALCLVFTYGKNQPKVLSDYLLEIVIEKNPLLIERYSSLGASGNFWFAIVQGIFLAGEDYTGKAVGSVAESIDSAAFCEDQHLESILMLTFLQMDRDYTVDLEHLTENQELAIRVVAAKAFPDAKSTYVNATELLRRYQLPDKREELDKLLGTNFSSQ